MSFKIDCSPIPSVAALTTAANLSTAQGQDSHSLGPRFHEFASPHRNTSHCGFSSGVASSEVCIAEHLNMIVQWVHEYLQVIRGYLIVYRATLLRAGRSCVRGEAILRINSFTDYKRSGLSMARKLNVSAARWNSFNSSPVRRSSSSLSSFGGSCHFAVLRSSLIWLALGPPTSSVPGVATPLASVSHSFQGAGDVLPV